MTNGLGNFIPDDSIDKSPIDTAARGFAAAFERPSGLAGTVKAVSATRTDSMF